MPARVDAALVQMRRWSLRRRVGVSFGTLAVMLAVLMAFTVISLVDFVHRGNDVVNRWGPADQASQALLSDLVNQETGVRGYALTGDPDALKPYTQYREQRPVDEQRLRAVIGRHHQILRDLAAFDDAAASWQSLTAQRLITIAQAGGAQTAERIDTLADKERFDAVRQRAAELNSDVRAEVRKARSARESALILLVVALSLAALLITLAALAVWRGLHRWVLSPVDELARQARAVTAGRPDARITARGAPEFIVMGQDFETMRRAAASALIDVETASAELARSNADLEQFAYVASHDLSEPLRKIANFCQLLERQYGPELDDKARQYIAFAVDGAKRMQGLIGDLLALSRVGRTTNSFAPVAMDAALERALESLDEVIEAAGAGIGHSELPIVLGDETLLVVLFENLIGNAVKYRGPEPPLIVVTAVEDRDSLEWTFSVSDNGIGVEPQYAERIFAIFQRLHLRETYPGTGIGLALCRKIVEFHGGRLWLDTQDDGAGATFRFTLPGRGSGER